MTSTHVPESVLRTLWLARFFDRTPLQTVDGRGVVVLAPGRINDDDGPDVRDAVVRIAGTVYAGDVEFHADASSWYRHGHGADPNFNGTILHVAFRTGPADSPALTLSGRVVPLVLVSPPGGKPERPPESSSLPCTGSVLPQSFVDSYLHELGSIRMQEKVRTYGERLTELREELQLTDRPLFPNSVLLREQLLYEGIMEALGYSKNREPFRRLARNLPIGLLRTIGLEDSVTMGALLLGAAGFLSSASAAGELSLLPFGRRWRTVRTRYRGPILGRSDWRLLHLRPANAPVPRLLGICLLLPRLFGNSSFGTLIGAFGRRRITTGELRTLIEARLTDEPGRRPELFRRARVPGRSRRLDMIVNVFVPVIALLGEEADNDRIRRRARDLYASIGPLQSNAVTRSMQRHLPGNPTLGEAITQQGSLLLHKRFCGAGRCGDCAIGRALDLPNIDFGGKTGYSSETLRRRTR